MSKFQEVLVVYDREFKKLGVSYDNNLLVAIAKSCGPSIYNSDASRVSTSDISEIDRVKRHFLIKKLGLKDSPRLDEGIQSVVAIFGSSNRNKYRAMFYYLLVLKFRKTNLYIDSVSENLTLSSHYDKIVSEDAKLLNRLAK